jgi:transposase-like protein
VKDISEAKKYDRSYKEQSVKPALKIGVKRAGEELKIPYETLYGWVQAAKNGIYTDTTKTKKSQRTQKYPQYVMDMLWELRKEQDEQCAGIGDKWVESDRLFVKWNGEPMNNQTPYGWLKEFCEKCLSTVFTVSVISQLRL